MLGSSSTGIHARVEAGHNRGSFPEPVPPPSGETQRVAVLFHGTRQGRATTVHKLQGYVPSYVPLGRPQERPLEPTRESLGSPGSKARSSAPCLSEGEVASASGGKSQSQARKPG